MTSTSIRLRSRIVRLAGTAFAAAAAAVVLSAAEPRPPVTATNTVAHPEYVRTKRADGTYQPETYTFGQGEFGSGRLKDASIDPLSFNQIARILTGPLAEQGYVPSRTAAETKLLIVVHWGTTIPFDDGQYRSGLNAISSVMSQQGPNLTPLVPTGPNGISGDSSLQAALNNAQQSELTSMFMMQEQFNRLRDRANDRNARLLGYAPSLARFGDMPGPLQSVRNDLVSEIEDDRYYVILAAFDFQPLWKKKEKRILWITRFSMRAQGHRFDRDLEAMARIASSHFGRATRDLVRTNRVERFEIGQPEFIRFEEKK